MCDRFKEVCTGYVLSSGLEHRLQHVAMVGEHSMESGTPEGGRSGLVAEARVVQVRGPHHTDHFELAIIFPHAIYLRWPIKYQISAAKAIEGTGMKIGGVQLGSIRGLYAPTNVSRVRGVGMGEREDYMGIQKTFLVSERRFLKCMSFRRH